MEFFYDAEKKILIDGTGEYVVDIFEHISPSQYVVFIEQGLNTVVLDMKNETVHYFFHSNETEFDEDLMWFRYDNHLVYPIHEIYKEGYY